jgi:VanZ family protein
MKNMTKNHTNHFLRYWFPVLLYCTVIFVQSSFPSPEQTPNILHFDKILHFFAYALLGMFFLRALRNTTMGYREGLVYVLAVLLTGIYGATDELHQYFVPMRSADWWDLFADFLGGCFGAYVYQMLLRRNPALERI